jgi:hypothetical protein
MYSMEKLTLKICDFGLSKMEELDELSIGPKGTPEYMCHYNFA